MSSPTPNPQPASHRYLTGKIARLPNDIREQVNRRLLDGQATADLLPWLNNLPAVKEILVAKFRGDPIKRQNIDSWRRTGYRLWLHEEQSTLRLQRLAGDARKISAADCRALARGTNAVVTGRLFELLQSAGSEKLTLDDFKKITTTVKPVVTSEQNETRLLQKDLQLRITRDKHYRDVVAIARRLLGDKVAEQIAAAPIDNSEMIEALGIHLFGKFWEPRPILPPGPPKPPPAT
jgi:hypothetical protein